MRLLPLDFIFFCQCLISIQGGVINILQPLYIIQTFHNSMPVESEEALFAYTLHLHNFLGISSIGIGSFALVSIWIQGACASSYFAPVDRICMLTMLLARSRHARLHCHSIYTTECRLCNCRPMGVERLPKSEKEFDKPNDPRHLCSSIYELLLDRSLMSCCCCRCPTK